MVFLVPTFFANRIVAENLFGVVNYDRMDISFPTLFVISILIILPLWIYINYLIWLNIDYRFYWPGAIFVSIIPSTYLVVNSIVNGV